MKILRTFVKQALWHSGAYAVGARARPWPGVAVLVYHGVRVGTTTALETSEELHVRRQVLESHLRVLRSIGTPISLSDWRNARRTGHALPARAVLVTFDDGYRSVLSEALPLLEKFEVPAVAFVCTGPSQTQRLLWYDALERQRRAAEIEHAKRLPYGEWRRLVEECSVAAGNDERAPLSPEQVAALAAHPLIEIGAHTVDHPILANASVSVQRQQIGESLDTLRQWTGRGVRAFAYPNGRPGYDFSPETVRIVRDLQIDCAFSTEPRIAEADDSMEAIPRFTMLDTIGEAQLARNLSVSWRR